MLIRHVTLWPWPLTLDLELCYTSSVMCSNSVQNLSEIEQYAQNYWPFSTFSPSSSRGWGTFSGLFFGMRGPNFTKLGEDTGRWWPSYEFVSELRYLAAFSNAGASNLSDVQNDAKIRTFWPPVKIRGGVIWASSLGKLLELHLRPNLRYTFDGRTLRVCWMPCPCKKRKYISKA